MADEPHGYGLARIVLEYIRSLIWPVAVVLAVVLFQREIRQIITEREVQVLGVRVGARIQEVNINVQKEVEELKRLLAEAEGGQSGNEDARLQGIKTKLSSLEKNLGREFDQIQQMKPVSPAGMSAATGEALAPPGGNERPTPSAQSWETAGFRALIDRDVDRAIDGFERAYQLSPDYHNVWEIYRLLKAERDALANRDSEAWRSLYQTLLTKYSWGMPADVRQAMWEAR